MRVEPLVRGFDCKIGLWYFTYLGRIQECIVKYIYYTIQHSNINVAFKVPLHVSLFFNYFMHQKS
jgi:hypothetical protein